MTSQPQRFLDHLAAHGWTVLRTTPTSTPAAAPLASTAATAPDRKREYGRTCCSTMPVGGSRCVPALRPISTAPWPRVAYGGDERAGRRRRGLGGGAGRLDSRGWRLGPAHAST
ncbi:MAG TPA: hypothetical protein DHL02_09415 [Achromobacter sp.]|nr:hypothetical protein [Achromobacter sp.]